MRPVVKIVKKDRSDQITLDTGSFDITILIKSQMPNLQSLMPKFAEIVSETQAGEVLFTSSDMLYTPPRNSKTLQHPNHR